MGITLFIPLLEHCEAADSNDKHGIVTATICSDSSLTNRHLKNVFITSEIQALHTTHRNFFRGGSITASKLLCDRLLIGIGVEYSYSPVHLDNGFRLTQVKFLPLFADARLFITNPKKRLCSFIEAAAGNSFANYDKQDPRHKTSYWVTEEGLYVYSGGGFVFKINDNLALPFSVGFKGFHISRNQLEINPHGIDYRIGCTIKF